MRRVLSVAALLAVLSMLAVLLASCGTAGSGGSGGSGGGGGSSAVQGTGQKGPFKAGGAVTARRLNSDGSRSSDNVSANVGANGDFDLQSLTWSGPTDVGVVGRFFDEVSGSFSSGKLTLDAVVDAGSASSVNVNLFTDFVAARTRALMAKGQAFGAALTQARSELEAIAGLSSAPDTLDLADASAVNQPGDSANLLLFSAALLDAGLGQSAVDAIAADFADNGKVDGSVNGDGLSAWQTVQQHASASLLSTARANIQSQYGTTPPDLPGGTTVGWEPDACTNARFSGKPVVCTDHAYSGNSGSLTDQGVEFIPTRPGFYTLAVDFTQSDRNNNFWLYDSYDATTKAFGTDVADGTQNTGGSVVEDVSKVGLSAGQTYYLRPHYGGSGTSDFTVTATQVTEGGYHPQKLTVGTLHDGTVGDLVGVDDTSSYVFTPASSGTYTIAAGQFGGGGGTGTLGLTLYRDDSGTGTINNPSNPGTELETANSDPSDVPNESNAYPGIRHQLSGGQTYFLVVRNETGDRTTSRPAPGRVTFQVGVTK